MNNCKHSFQKEYSEGSPAIMCAIKERVPSEIFIAMKNRYETLHKGLLMTFSKECEYARHIDGQGDCPCFETE